MNAPLLEVQKREDVEGEEESREGRKGIPSCPWELRGYTLMRGLCIYHFNKRKDKEMFCFNRKQGLSMLTWGLSLSFWTITPTKKEAQAPSVEMQLMNSVGALQRALTHRRVAELHVHSPASPTSPWEDKQGQWILCHALVPEAGRNSLQFKATAVTLPTRLLFYESVTSNRRNQQAAWLIDATRTNQVSQQWEHRPQPNYCEFIHLLIIRNFLGIWKGNGANFSILSRWNNH